MCTNNSNGGVCVCVCIKALIFEGLTGRDWKEANEKMRLIGPAIPKSSSPRSGLMWGFGVGIDASFRVCFDSVWKILIGLECSNSLTRDLVQDFESNHRV